MYKATIFLVTVQRRLASLPLETRFSEDLGKLNAQDCRRFTSDQRPSLKRLCCKSSLNFPFISNHQEFRTWVENTRTSVYVTDLQLIKITLSQVPFAWVFQMFFQVNLASTLTGTKFTRKYSIKRIIIVYSYLMINSADFLGKLLPAKAARRFRQRIHTWPQLLKCKRRVYHAFMNEHISGSLTREIPDFVIVIHRI